MSMNLKDKSHRYITHWNLLRSNVLFQWRFRLQSECYCAETELCELLGHRLKHCEVIHFGKLSVYVRLS